MLAVRHSPCSDARQRPRRLAGRQLRRDGMDLSKLNMGEKVVGVSGVLLFVFSLFKWLGFTYKVGPVSVHASASAWSFTLCWIAVVIGILMVGYVVTKLL